MRTFKLDNVQKPIYLEKPEKRENRITVKEQKIIAVGSSGKGGTGKTTFTVHLAHMLRKMGKSTVLVDLDIPHGDIAVLLKTGYDRSIVDWIDIPDGISPSHIENLCLEAGNGFLVIPSIRTLSDQGKVNHRTFAEKIAARLADYEVIIFDTGPNLEPITLGAYDVATDIYLMCEYDEASLTNVYRGIKEYKSQGGDISKAKLIINKLDRQPKVDLIKRLTGVKEIHFLPLEARMNEIRSKGDWLHGKRKHPYTKTLTTIVADLFPKNRTETIFETNRKGILSYLFGRG
jgi:MinD-like ATPase involved in chromosome partitioning or flagellar assembly